MGQPAQAVSALAALARNDNLRRVQLAWGASITAEWAHFVALGVFAYKAGGASAVGVAGLVRLLPAAIVAPFAASLGDRFRRERFLLAMALVGSAAPASSSSSAPRPSRPRHFSFRACESRAGSRWVRPPTRAASSRRAYGRSGGPPV